MASNTATVAKWGNSHGLRLPKNIVQLAGLKAGDKVEITVRDQAVTMRPIKPRARLDDLLSRFEPKKHRRKALLDDAPKGRESF